MEERARALKRSEKALEGVNIKLASVVSDIDGKSSRRMIDMRVSDCNDVQAIVGYSVRQIPKKIPHI